MKPVNVKQVGDDGNIAIRLKKPEEDTHNCSEKLTFNDPPFNSSCPPDTASLPVSKLLDHPSLLLILSQPPSRADCPTQPVPSSLLAPVALAHPSGTEDRG